jgi:fimbrial isopeptide formation D2 family protein
MIRALNRRSSCIIVLVACVLMALVLAPANALAGEVAISGTNAKAYKAYQVFDADVTYRAEQQKDVASNISWASDAARSAAESVAGRSFATAQDAADWMQQSLSDGNEADYRLAKALIASGATATDLTAGKAAELSEGYWLVVADDSALGVSEAGTAPVFVLVGTGSKTVEPKSSVPTVEKHVQENSTGKWQKAADATVGDDVFWRLEATVHAGLEGYDSYRVWFEDRMSEGLDPSRVSSSAKVYLVAGTGSSFDGATSWTDITGQCTVTVKGQTFEIESPDLVAALGSDVLGSQGAQVCVIYSAPLNQQCNHGAAEGNPNTVHLEYPKSPLSGSERSKTPDSKATAYTWNLQLTKRSKEGDAVLSGAVLDIVDPSGRHLSQDGSWTTNGFHRYDRQSGPCDPLRHRLRDLPHLRDPGTARLRALRGHEEDRPHCLGPRRQAGGFGTSRALHPGRGPSPSRRNRFHDEPPSGEHPRHADASRRDSSRNDASQGGEPRHGRYLRHGSGSAPGQW